MKKHLQLFLFYVLLLIFWTHAAAISSPDESLDFPDEDLEDKIAAVNEGQLEFITVRPEKPVHEHINQIIINQKSIENGWVKLNQCHINLDPISAIDIRFNADKVRNLKIVSKQNIEDASVNGHIIELKNIKPNAKICLEADSRALHKLNDNQLQLRNGPFMRQFLDGFYPLQVTVDVIYPASIRLTDFEPNPVPAGEVKLATNRITWSALFEGRLFTRFTFERK